LTGFFDFAQRFIQLIDWDTSLTRTEMDAAMPLDCSDAAVTDCTCEENDFLMV